METSSIPSLSKNSFQESAKPKKSEVLFLNRYRLGRNIGQGSQGQVKLALDMETGKRVAIKIYKHRKMTSLDFVYLQREVNILIQLQDHKAFVQIIDFAENICYMNGHGQKEIVSAIVMEYANNGCLFDLVVFFREQYNEQIIKQIALQLIDAIEYMQKFQISHRDIKLENIVIDSNYNLKVIDFGLAVQETRDGKPKSNVGTSPFAPPERFLGKEYSGEKFDIFSLGVLLFFLKFHYYPFIDNNPDNSQIDGSFFIFSQNRVQYWQEMIQNENIEDLHFIDMINSMLQANPSLRPDIQQLREHPFLRNSSTLNIQTFLSMRKEIMSEMMKKQKKEKLVEMNQNQEQVCVEIRISQNINCDNIDSQNNGKGDTSSIESTLSVPKIITVGDSVVFSQGTASAQQPQNCVQEATQEFQQEVLINSPQIANNNNLITIDCQDNQQQLTSTNDSSILCESTDNNNDSQSQSHQEISHNSNAISSDGTDVQLAPSLSSLISNAAENYNFTCVFALHEQMPKQQIQLTLSQQFERNQQFSQHFFLKNQKDVVQKSSLSILHHQAEEPQNLDSFESENVTQQEILKALDLLLRNGQFLQCISPTQAQKGKDQEEPINKIAATDNNKASDSSNQINIIQFLSLYVQQSSNQILNYLFQYHSFLLLLLSFVLRPSQQLIDSSPSFQQQPHSLQQLNYFNNQFINFHHHNLSSLHLGIA